MLVHAAPSGPVGAVPEFSNDLVCAPRGPDAQRSRMRAGRGWIAAIVMVGALFLCGSPALASTVACGDTITASTTLRADMTGCPNIGLVIGADHVTLDLNGHTISGDDAETPDCPADARCDRGILNQGHDHVSVIDGTLTGFTVGVVNVAASRIRVLNITSENEFLGVVINSSDHALVTNNVFHGGLTGVLLTGTRRSTVSRNSASDTEGIAIFLGDSNDNRVEGNFLAAIQHGIGVEEGSSRNTVRGNTMTHGGGIDIGGDGATANRVDSNRLIDVGDGVVVGDAQGTLIRRNKITNAGFGGPEESGGFGVILDGADRTTVERNIITGGRGPAILVTTFELPGTQNNTLIRNVANSAGDDAIRVENGATGTRVERNIAIDSPDDGIDIEVDSTTLARNIASRNADLGIEALPGVTDAGGNRAFGNGNPAQCTSIVCAP